MTDTTETEAQESQRYKRITGDARQQLAADLRRKYTDGASIRDLADEIGRSYGFVHGILVENEVKLRRQGGRHSKASR